MVKKNSLIAVMIIALTYTSRAWVYPEHRDITLLAIQKLDSTHRVMLDRLWAEARRGYENRLGKLVADATQNVHPKYLDYAAFPAIAGDHSTSSDDMLHTILKADWILNVADVAARLKNGLAASQERSEREGVLRDSDLRLMRADPEYASRAGSNYVHFMLARPEENTSASTYFEVCYKEGTEVNLIGTYTWYHTSALVKARRLATEYLTPEQQSSLALAILADEAFALHFLEDGFSAGHVTGIWGNSSLRKGTHDYYNEHGLEVTTWHGERMILSGDAYMRQADAEIAANSASLSLEQVLDVARGSNKLNIPVAETAVFTPDTFNIAKAVIMPEHRTDTTFREALSEILIHLPVPGLPTGLGEIPRFRSQIGPFIGIAPVINSSVVSGGFGKTQTSNGTVSGFEFAAHTGFGLDGVLNESGDGLVFLDLGMRLDGGSSIKINPGVSNNQFGSILTAIPSRRAYYVRLRLPFYLIPGDLLLAGPFMMLFARKSFAKMITTASQGGLIPWQSGMITRFGKIQFILGREVGVYIYGLGDDADSYMIPDDRWTDIKWSLISMRTTKLDFPILEYRPMRTFSRQQSASLLFQLNAGVDIPGEVTMQTHPDAEPIQLKPIWMVGIKMGFDWRYYYSNEQKK